MLKVAIVVSHPIQHFCPQYVSFAGHPEVRMKVFFASALGLRRYLDPNFRTEISWGNLNLEKFDHVFLNGDQILPSDSSLDAISLDRELSSFDPGLVIIYGYFQKLQRRAHSWARRNKVKLAYISDSELRQKRNMLRQWLKGFFLRNYFADIDFFLSVGDANEEFYHHHGVTGDKILRMHFPIDVQHYSAEFSRRGSLRSKLRKSYGIESGRPVLIVVGKLTAWKSQDKLIDALGKLEQDGLFMDLFIVGSGIKEKAWKQRAAGLVHSRVHFTGFVKIEDLPGYYAASDIYVHPAEVEPHSIAVSEAIYMGLPVIVSDRCGSYGPTDDVQENRNGYKYSFGNINDLCAKIRRLVDNQTILTEFGETSHQISLQNQEQAHYGVLDELVSVIKR